MKRLRRLQPLQNRKARLRKISKAHQSASRQRSVAFTLINCSHFLSTDSKMQPTTKAVLVAWVAMLQLAVAMPMADLGTARGGERSATRAGDPHPGAIHSIQEYNTRDVFPRPATFSEPAKSGPFQGDEGSIQARFTFARDGEHWVVVPPIARRTDFESARSEVVGQSLVAGEESADLRDISTAENVAVSVTYS